MGGNVSRDFFPHLEDRPMIHEEFPPINPDVLKALEERFPDRLPDTYVDPQNFNMRIGEQRVIRFLRAQLQRQQKNILDNR